MLDHCILNDCLILYQSLVEYMVYLLHCLDCFLLLSWRQQNKTWLRHIQPKYYDHPSILIINFLNEPQSNWNKLLQTISNHPYKSEFVDQMPPKELIFCSKKQATEKRSRTNSLNSFTKFTSISADQQIIGSQRMI